MSIGPSGLYRPPSPVAAAFRAGWLVAQLHGPILGGPLEATGPLPAVAQLGRAQRVGVATAELRALLTGPLARALDGVDVGRGAAGELGPDVGPFATAGLDAAALADDPDVIRRAVEGFHPDLLVRLTVADGRLGTAYSTGIALSEACWETVTLADFRAHFQRSRLGTLKGWLGEIAGGLAQDASAVVGQSIDHWGAWVAVHDKLDWDKDGSAVLRSVRTQGEHWRALLAGDTEPHALLSPDAYLHAGERAINRSRTVMTKIFLRFWPIFLLIAAVVGASVFLAIYYAHGTARVWGSLLSLSVGLGLTTTGLKQGTSRLAKQAEIPLMAMANSDAMGWACTWLPTIDDSRRTRRALRRRGVAPPPRPYVSGPATGRPVVPAPAGPTWLSTPPAPPGIAGSPGADGSGPRSAGTDRNQPVG